MCTESYFIYAVVIYIIFQVVVGVWVKKVDRYKEFKLRYPNKIAYRSHNLFYRLKEDDLKADDLLICKQYRKRVKIVIIQFVIFIMAMCLYSCACYF